MNAKTELTYTFTRPGFDPLNCTIEMKSDQPAQAIDRAAAFLYAAVEALECEARLCQRGTKRSSEVDELICEVRELHNRSLKIPAQ